MTGTRTGLADMTAILDPMPGYQRLALIKGGTLTDIFVHDMSDKTAAYGAVFMARVAAIFPQHNRLQLNLGEMGMASMRVSKPSQFSSGQLVPVTVQAEPREQKPAQMRYGILRQSRFAILHVVPNTTGQLHLSQRLKAYLADHSDDDLSEICAVLRDMAADHACQITLRQTAASEPSDIVLNAIKAQLAAIKPICADADKMREHGIVAAPPALLSMAEQYVSAEHIIIDDGRSWADAEIDQQLDQALSPYLSLPDGGGIYISSPPGAAVIDGDSAASRLAPEALAMAMIAPLADHIRLRRISGAIVVDFPRLNHGGRDRIHQAMMTAFADDPLRPILHGWTKGGLYTLERRHQLRPLGDMLDGDSAPAKYAAIMALRHIWQQTRNIGNNTGKNIGSDGLPPPLRLTQAAQDWLNGDGVAIRDAVCMDLPLPPEWITVAP